MKAPSASPLDLVLKMCESEPALVSGSRCWVRAAVKHRHAAMMWWAV
jgi:hypothetical protein